MGTKQKQKKNNETKFKSLEDRKEEVERMKKELDKLGLSEEISGIKEFYVYCSDYVEKDIPWSGRIKLNGLKRILEAILPRKKIVKATLSLKYDETV